MAEFTGERIIPGQVDPDLLNEHLARYAFAARFARGKRVLDAGCGTGYGSAELAKTALSVLGVDNSAEALSLAREEYRLPNLMFEQGSCATLPHPDGSFDLAVAFEVIEHLEQWREFLVEMQRVLVPSGQFIVSTPNKLYYAESRGQSGPNPFHVHEFEFAEFESELGTIFPQISLFLENHVSGVVFQPVEGAEESGVRVDGAESSPADAHFFVAVCGHRPQTGNASFVYVPSSANVLRERERHIDLLDGQLATKKTELAELHRRHEQLLGELQQSNRWAQELDGRLGEAGGRIQTLQRELSDAQMAAQTRINELEEENRRNLEWSAGVRQELGAKVAELAKCVEYLHAAERTVEERTAWALEVERKLNLIRASPWVRMARKLGLGPDLAAK